MRSALRIVPGDAITWVDLAREYSALGQQHPARKALRTALALSPGNRFVLRSASRFFLHAGDPEEAHSVLRRAQRTRRDPWLLAAEIVAAQASSKTSRWITQARDMVRGGKHHPRHISELAGALGTLEYWSGQRRAVRRMFRHALVDPTENLVAQAGWVSRHMKGFEVPQEAFAVPRAYEAAAWEAAVTGHFDQAVNKAWEWFSDEPFATRPALFGSWVAGVAQGDYETSIDLAQAGRLANPSDPGLMAQLIYAYGSLGRVEEAAALLDQLPTAIRKSPLPHDAVEWDILMMADRGLIAFRSERIAEGRELYEKAVALAKEHDLRHHMGSALLHWSREETLASVQSPLPVDQLRTALELFPASVRPMWESFVARIQQLVLP
jgi:tetratricopeptide (TPR) repeat protein